MSLFDDEKTSTLDIPDFIEDKDKDTSDVDMSIFKMSDDELYDDVPKKKEHKNSNLSSNPNKKKSNSTLVLCLVLCGILLLASIGAIIYGANEHSKVSKLNEEISQLKAQNTDLNTKVQALNTQVNDLTKKLDEEKNAGGAKDPNNKYPKGTTLYVTEDGQGMTIKKKASADAEAIDADKTYADWGDEFVLLEDAILDSNGNYWGKTKEGFIRIEYNGEIWCSTEEQ